MTEDRRAWFGVDLDGTLAYCDGCISETVIGKPIAPMVTRVKKWIEEGKRVKIMTARAVLPESVKAIEKWCLEHLGKVLEVTDKKDFLMIELWDDRAVQVITNIGVKA